jgi:hypothetical protein
VCIGRCADETIAAKTDGARIVALSKGYVAPALTAFASTLGLAEIEAEGSTQDGYNNDVTFSRAVDGLALDTKNLREAYLKGVTKAISAPTFIYGGSKGVSVGFRTGAMHAQEQHAVWQDEVALHYTLTKTNMAPSLSGAIGLLKSKLLKAVTSNNTELVGEARYLKKVVQGAMTLVLTVHSADLIASLLRVKADVEAAISAKDASSTAQLRLVLVGGAESHLLADKLAAANVSVVLAPLLPYSETWDQRRSLTGAPMTNGTTIDVLHAAGVQVAIGTEEDWETRDLYLSAGIAYANGGGKISERDALAFVSSNIYDMLGIKDKKSDGTNEFVVFEGNPLEINSRIRAVADGTGSVSLWS